MLNKEVEPFQCIDPNGGRNLEKLMHNKQLGRWLVDEVMCQCASLFLGRRQDCEPRRRRAALLDDLDFRNLSIGRALMA